MAKKRAKKRVKEIIEETEPQGDLHALVESVKEKPFHYGGGLAFIIICVFAGLLYSESTKISQDEATTAYVRALEGEEPSEVTGELEKLSQDSGKDDPKVLYMIAEQAFATEDYEKAKVAFLRVRTEFPDSDVAPDAVEGLANIAEEAEQYEEAATIYAEIEEKWPLSFASKRQRFNVARCQERQGKMAEAVKAYQEQANLFPDSAVARDAQGALARIKASHPDLFPEVPEPVVEAAPVEAPVETPAETPAQ
jgi:tetratricopeptide (TPR) repeat protein